VITTLAIKKKEHVEIVYYTTFSVCILSLSKNLLAMVVRYHHSGLFGYSCYFGGFNIIDTMHARGIYNFRKSPV